MLWSPILDFRPLKHPWKLTSRSFGAVATASPGKGKKGGAKRRRGGHQKGSQCQIIQIISSCTSWHQLVHEDYFCHIVSIWTEKVSSKDQLGIFPKAFVRWPASFWETQDPCGECRGSEATGLGYNAANVVFKDFFFFNPQFFSHQNE